MTRLSFSSISQFAKSPAHYLAYKNRQQTESAAMRFGSAVHMAILESPKFRKEYMTTDFRKNTIKFKEQQASNPDAKFLTGSEMFAINQIQDNINSNDMAHDLLMGCDKREQLVKAKINGIEFVGYVDALAKDYFIDLKTTKDASPEAFERSAWNFKYYLQGAVYRELTGVSDFWIMAIENNPPYSITSYKLSEEYLDRGLTELHMLIDEFKRWDGMTSGYRDKNNTGHFELNAPRWA